MSEAHKQYMESLFPIPIEQPVEPVEEVQECGFFRTTNEEKRRKGQNNTMPERTIRVTIIDDKSFEYHLIRSEQEVRNILDPDVPDEFIEVPVPAQLQGSVKRNFLHTSRIARLWIHDELEQGELAQERT